MAIALRSFLDLLPYRIDQAIAGRALRRIRVLRRRRKAVHPVDLPVGVSRRLYIDVAVICRNDAGTGIQRVVRALALALRDEKAAKWDIVFVGATRRRPYHVISWPETDAVMESRQMEGRDGDVFFGLDFSLDALRFHRNQLDRFQRCGGKLWFLIYDLLPAERPEWFSPNMVIRYKAWLELLAGVADGFFSISQQTQDDLTRLLDQCYGLTSGYKTKILPMGHSIRESMLEVASDDEDAVVPMRIDVSQPFSLMVGTLEPRKGHADILAGFSELWRQGATDRLVLVGRMGWQTDGLREAILAHPEYGRNLLWHDDVEDVELECIYQSCQGVIIGSHAEGFGLPLIEALGHEKPVLARDLPVFRTHEHLGVRYFPVNGNSRVVADYIRNWIAQVQGGEIVVTRPNASWKEAAEKVFSAIA